MREGVRLGLPSLAALRHHAGGVDLVLVLARKPRRLASSSSASSHSCLLPLFALSALVRRHDLTRGDVSLCRVSVSVDVSA